MSRPESNDARSPIDDRPAGFSGVILAGGASSRMGRDKSLIEIGGRSLVVATAEVLWRSGASEVFVVGGDETALAHLGLDVRADDRPGEGPLGGILTALRLAGNDIVMILACDMPDIDPGSVRSIVAALEASPEAEVALALASGRRQYVTAAYRRSARTRIAEAWQAGVRAPRIASRYMSVEEVGGLDERRLRDLDRPEDLHRYADRDRTPPPRREKGERDHP